MYLATLDAKTIEPQMKFTHHWPGNLHFTIASFEILVTNTIGAITAISISPEKSQYAVNKLVEKCTKRTHFDL